MPRAKKKVGRRTKLTKKLQADLVKQVEGGVFLHTACALLGVALKTVEEWVRRGEDRDKHRPSTPLYAEFAVAMRGAEAAIEQRAVESWVKRFPEDWRACDQFLSKRFPQTWGNLVDKEAAQAETEFDLSEPDVVDPELGADETSEEDR